MNKAWAKILATAVIVIGAATVIGWFAVVFGFANTPDGQIPPWAWVVVVSPLAVVALGLVGYLVIAAWVALVTYFTKH